MWVFVGGSNAFLHVLDLFIHSDTSRVVQNPIVFEISPDLESLEIFEAKRRRVVELTNGRWLKLLYRRWKIEI